MVPSGIWPASLSMKFPQSRDRNGLKLRRTSGWIAARKKSLSVTSLDWSRETIRWSPWSPGNTAQRWLQRGVTPGIFRVGIPEKFWLRATPQSPIASLRQGGKMNQQIRVSWVSSTLGHILISLQNPPSGPGSMPFAIERYWHQKPLPELIAMVNGRNI